jgi:hypothetical protein
VSVESQFRRGRGAINPRGRIVRNVRVTGEDEGAVLSVSAPGIIVHVRTDAESRRTIRRFAVRHGLILTPVEFTGLDGSFDRRTGRARGNPVLVPYVWQACGPVDALRELATHPAVVDWSFALDVRPPRAAGGSGELTERGKRGLRDARREASERFTACERADRRGDNPDRASAELRHAARSIGANPSDPDVLASVGELLRLARRGEGNLSADERNRVTILRARLGV